jgi:hypothetical protein
MIKCRWCKGIGKIKLIGKGWIPCLNCKGSKEGIDGGPTIQVGTKPWLKGNKHNKWSYKSI